MSEPNSTQPEGTRMRPRVLSDWRARVEEVRAGLNFLGHRQSEGGQKS